MYKLKFTITALLVSLSFIACNDDNTIVTPEDPASTDTVIVADTSSIDLSENEIAGLLFMREEEKLARDVYLYFYGKYEMKIFNNISNAESKHMAELKTLIDTFQLTDPVINDDEGIFQNQDLANLYQQLISAGDESLVEALKIGATIEDLDISDLMKYESEVTNNDIIATYENLTKGSRNHLRAFYPQIIENGGTYEPQYISQELFDEIINSEKENGQDTCTTELTEAEIHGLLFMREEEKLARDVYLHFYTKYQMKIFDNISNAESKHMSELKVLIDKYSLTDPVTDYTPGIFKNEDLASLYTQLIDAGDVSLVEALKIGATIEDLDIRDLMLYETEVNNTDIINAYENLTKGSRNHLRAFYPKILENGGTYEAQFISQELFDEIVNSEKENGQN